MSYIPLRVKNISIGDDNLILTVSFFEIRDEINEFIPKEYIFKLDEVMFVSLGYIRNVEEIKEDSFRISKMFKKMVSMGLSGEKKEKVFNLKEEMILDIVIFREEYLFFRIDLTVFNYKDFLGEDFSFSSFINMRKFIHKFSKILPQSKVDDIIFNFLSTNSLSKIQYFSSVYEFQDYLLSKVKGI
ncbi:MAG: hypothetical protein ACK4ZM_03635, partial [bacterium]